MADPISNAPTEPGQPGQPGGRSATLQPGMVVGDTYEITRMIGQGGMGAVWEAKHLRLPGKRVVVKVLLYGVTEPTVLARFRREAEIGSRLGHPNIVQVLDFNTLPGGAPYIVLELLHGETLAARLRRGRLSREQIMSVVSQVGSALSAAHREGIVHRDLKPDNIFLCPTDHGGEIRDVVKILDFGISKMRGSVTVLTQDSALVGTPQYMAPEQATGANDEIDARTDIFALGAITFEMFAGRPPFWGDSLASVVHAVVYAQTPSLLQYAPEVGPAISGAVERALSKSRDARFAEVAGFVKAITTGAMGTAATVISGVGVGSGPSAAPPPATPAPGQGGTQILAGGPSAGRERVTTPERPQKAIPTDRVIRPKSSPALPLVVGASAIAIVAVVVLLMRRPPAPPPARVPPPQAQALRPVEPKQAPEPEKVVEPKHVAEPEKPAVAGTKPTGGGAKSHPSPISPAAAADLDEAEAALAAGKATDALRLAQHSLYAQKTGRAYAIMARARCAEGDLGNAKAAFAHVDPGARAQVLRACRNLGMELK